jgi:hypothetical protein
MPFIEPPDTEVCPTYNPKDIEQAEMPGVNAPEIMPTTGDRRKAAMQPSVSQAFHTLDRENRRGIIACP